MVEVTGRGSPVGTVDLRREVQLWRDAAPADEVSRYAHLWLRVPFLDGVYLAREAIRNCYEFLAIRRQDRVQSRVFRQSIPLLDSSAPSPEFALSAVYRQSNNLPRLAPADGDDLQAIDVFLRLAEQRLHDGRPIPDNELKQWRSLVYGCLQAINEYIRNPLALSNDGKRQVSPFVQFTFVSVLVGLTRLAKTDLLNENPAPCGDALELVVDRLLSAEFLVASDTGLAFRRAADRDGCLTTTDFAFRLAASLHELSDWDAGAIAPSERLTATLTERSQGFLAFLRACEDPEGGFLRNPKAKRPNLVHTRAALHLRRSIALLRDAVDATPYHDLDESFFVRQLRFINNCWQPGQQYGGFANSRDNRLATLSSMRSAANSLKLTDLSRAIGDFHPTSEYESQLDLATSRIKDTFRFVYDCMHSEHKVVYVLPHAAADARERSRVADRAMGSLPHPPDDKQPTQIDQIGLAAEGLLAIVSEDRELSAQECATLLDVIVGIASLDASPARDAALQIALQAATRHFSRQLFGDTSFGYEEILERVLEGQVVFEHQPAKDLFNVYSLTMDADAVTDVTQLPPDLSKVFPIRDERRSA